MNEQVKDIHFQVPNGLAEAFNQLYPGHGEKKAILTKFIVEAVRLRLHKDCFVDIVKDKVKKELTKP